ncbi:MAG: SDR family oxidoreductase [Deltaproteobacteria bacterium]|nr:SDR family oxidoreductase [Deltaproteobacteria bacterium]
MGTFGFESTAEEVTADLDLSGKTYVVTGCNSGIGLETARVLALRGAHVIGTARTEQKAREAVGERGTALECELSDPPSVRRCAAALRAFERPLDAIICNAGIMALPSPQPKFGLDLQLLTNHIGHFLLVTEAMDRLAPDGRVVMVSSGAHFMAPESGIEFDNLSGEKDYSPFKQYGQSKLANVLFAKELARRWATTRRTANALHPGVIRTNLGRHAREQVDGFLQTARTKTIPQGAATQCLVATRPEVATTTGEYFSDCRIAPTSPLAQSAELAARLWERSEQIAAELPRA